MKGNKADRKRERDGWRKPLLTNLARAQGIGNVFVPDRIPRILWLGRGGTGVGGSHGHHRLLY